MSTFLRTVLCGAAVVAAVQGPMLTRRPWLRCARRPRGRAVASSTATVGCGSAAGPGHGSMHYRASQPQTESVARPRTRPTEGLQCAAGFNPRADSDTPAAMRALTAARCGSNYRLRPTRAAVRHAPRRRSVG